jgi:hypothetical protein
MKFWRCMVGDLKDGSRIEILLRDASQPFQLHGPCLIRVYPRDNSRVVKHGANAVRIALTAAELPILCAAMNRAYPRFGAVVPRMRDRCNERYVPGENGRPFLVAFGAGDAVVKVGMEIADNVAHPVVQLLPRSGSNVRRAAASVSWMPTWTEFRVLCAHFEQTALQTEIADNPAGTLYPSVCSRRTRISQRRYR